MATTEELIQSIQGKLGNMSDTGSQQPVSAIEQPTTAGTVGVNAASAQVPTVKEPVNDTTSKLSLDTLKAEDLQRNPKGVAELINNSTFQDLYKRATVPDEIGRAISSAIRGTDTYRQEEDRAWYNPTKYLYYNTDTVPTDVSNSIAQSRDNYLGQNPDVQPGLIGRAINRATTGQSLNPIDGKYLTNPDDGGLSTALDPLGVTSFTLDTIGADATAEAMRQHNAQFAESNPAESFVAGSIIPTIVTGGIGAGASTVGQFIRAGATANGALGAIGGLAEGRNEDTSAGDRIYNALTGGLAGAAIGGATAPLGYAAGKTISSLGNGIQNIANRVTNGKTYSQQLSAMTQLQAIADISRTNVDDVINYFKSNPDATFDGYFRSVIPDQDLANQYSKAYSSINKQINELTTKMARGNMSEATKGAQGILGEDFVNSLTTDANKIISSKAFKDAVDPTKLDDILEANRVSAGQAVSKAANKLQVNATFMNRLYSGAAEDIPDDLTNMAMQTALQNSVKTASGKAAIINALKAAGDDIAPYRSGQQTLPVPKFYSKGEIEALRAKGVKVPKGAVTGFEKSINGVDTFVPVKTNMTVAKDAIDVLDGMAKSKLTPEGRPFNGIGIKEAGDNITDTTNLYPTMARANAAYSESQNAIAAKPAIKTAISKALGNDSNDFATAKQAYDSVADLIPEDKARLIRQSVAENSNFRSMISSGKGISESQANNIRQVMGDDADTLINHINQSAADYSQLKTLTGKVSDIADLNLSQDTLQVAKDIVNNVDGINKNAPVSKLLSQKLGVDESEKLNSFVNDLRNSIPLDNSRVFPVDETNSLFSRKGAAKAVGRVAEFTLIHTGIANILRRWAIDLTVGGGGGFQNLVGAMRNIGLTKDATTVARFLTKQDFGPADEKIIQDAFTRLMKQSGRSATLGKLGGEIGNIIGGNTSASISGTETPVTQIQRRYDPTQYDNLFDPASDLGATPQ